MTPQSIYPIDFATLKKGDTFDHWTLLGIVGLKEGPVAQRVAFLRLKGLIERRRPDLPVVSLTTNGQDQFTLRILNDAEAARWTHRRCWQGVRALGRGLKREARVDMNQLSEAQKKTYEHDLQHDARMYLAVRRAAQQTVEVDQNRIWRLVGQPLRDTRRADALERARLLAEKQLNPPEAP